MSNRIEHLTIVGGGTAGWMTAMIVNTFINAFRNGPPVRVTVIESPNIPTVGVGEATVSGIVQLFEQLGLNESDFFKTCNASFKLGVRFTNWAEDAQGQPISFIHPFNAPRYLGGVPPAYHCRKFGLPPGCNELADAMGVNSTIIRGWRAPRRAGGADYEKEIGYSYHLDAGLFAKFLREESIRRGITLISDDVVDWDKDERGYISALHLKNEGRLPVEFIVDCTGFKSLFLQGAMEEPFVSYGDQLLCDSAIPVQLPHRDPTQLEPCTSSTALGAGWVWRVPLYSRVGTGYVYSSKFRSEDEARAEFFAHLRRVGDLPEDAPDPETRTIKMKIGRARRAWVNNVLGIGLCGGFIEPLESTAIYMIEMAARWLVGYFPDKDVSPALAARYNTATRNLYEEVRDFIVMHYATSNRQDPFWKAARDGIEVPDSLRERLEGWRHVMPDAVDLPGYKVFSPWNYLYCLWPKGYVGDRAYPMEGSISRQHWDAFTARLNNKKQGLMSVLPSHYELLTQIRARAEAASSAPAAAGAMAGAMAGS